MPPVPRGYNWDGELEIWDNTSVKLSQNLPFCIFFLKLFCPLNMLCCNGGRIKEACVDPATCVATHLWIQMVSSLQNNCKQD